MNYLDLSWSVSRGRETYGYNICRLDDQNTGKRYKCLGGGYDMVGTVIGQWLEDVYQEQLKQFIQNNSSDLVDYGNGYRKQLPNFYGLFVRPDGSVHLDGGCGDDCMRKIAEAIGVKLSSNYNQRKRRTVGYFVEV